MANIYSQSTNNMNAVKIKIPRLKIKKKNKVNLRWRADHKSQSMDVSDEVEFEAAISFLLARQDLCTRKPDQRQWKQK